MADPNSGLVRRTYVSAVRTEQAAATRSRVTRAAAEGFAEKGWSGTTLAYIARLAEVTPQAVHLSVGPKPALLKAALVDAVGGGDAEDAQLEQELFSGMLAPGLSVRDRAVAWAEASHAVHVRAGRLFAVLAQAAQTDEDLARWRQSIGARRMELCRALVSACGVPADRAARVGDLVFVLSSTSVYYEFSNLGWSAASYEEWLVAALVDVLSSVPGDLASVDVQDLSGDERR